jgi:Domain of unknown function (DUF4326)
MKGADLTAPVSQPRTEKTGIVLPPNTPKILNNKQLRGTVANSVYIGRPSMWGNPFVIGKDGSRTDVIAKYERWLIQQLRLLVQLDRLRGRHLVCWCAPQPCHGDVLLRLANTSTLRRS